MVPSLLAASALKLIALSKVEPLILLALTFTSTRRLGASPGPSSSLATLGASKERSLMYWATTRICGCCAVAAGALTPSPLPALVASVICEHPFFSTRRARCLRGWLAHRCRLGQRGSAP